MVICNSYVKLPEGTLLPASSSWRWPQSWCKCCAPLCCSRAPWNRPWWLGQLGTFEVVRRDLSVEDRDSMGISWDIYILYIYCIYIYILYLYMHISIYTCIYIYIYLFMHIYRYYRCTVCMYIYTYICICAQTTQCADAPRTSCPTPLGHSWSSCWRHHLDVRKWGDGGRCLKSKLANVIEIWWFNYSQVDLGYIQFLANPNGTWPSWEL